MRRRSKQVAEVHPMDGMRSMWEFVFISQFLRLFESKFGFVHFEVEELENAFMEAENYPLFSIFASLLRFLLAKEVRMTDWEAILRAELDERETNPNPLEEGSYAEVAPANRVLLMKELIDYVCDGDGNKFKEMKEFKEDFLNPDSQKRKPVGQDAQGHVYWYFDGLRLYREKNTKRGTKKSWATVCTNKEEWQNLIKSLQKNKESEKTLHDYLRDELYPSIEPLLKEHEKENDLKNKRKKSRSPKSKKDSSKEEERDALIKKEEEDIAIMRQEEESEKPQHIVEKQHRKKGRRKKTEIEKEPSSPETNDTLEEDSSEEPQEEQERITNDINKDESITSPDESGLGHRSRRKCVIIREQTKKKKEWWDEEGIGSDLEEEEDVDSDSSDGPKRRKKKPKLMRPAEPPGPQNRTYVFSTAMANRAAEAVQYGRVESLIAYHRAQQTTSPYLRLEPERTFDKSYDQQKAYFSQGFQQPGMQGMMPRGFVNAGSGTRPGYNTAQWQQFQMQQQYVKDRQTRQTGVEDLSQILFGGAMNGNGQNPPGTGSYAQRPGMPGQQYGFPPRMGGPQQSPYQDNRMQEGYRAPFQQGYPQQQQQQQYFQRARNLPLHSPGAQSPSADPLGANVRSPPPPYPGGRQSETRPQQAMGNSPAAVPSPTSTGSPQTPLTPHAPARFPGATPSPGEPSKPPFSPTNPQQPNYTAAGSYPGPKRPSSESSGSETGYQSVSTSQQQGYTQDGPLQSPTKPHSMSSSKSPFLSASTSQTMSSASASMAKSFSVESLTAPTAPSDQSGHSMAPEQQMGPYSSIYYQSKYQPPAMYGGQRYQYPSTIQHSGGFYNSQPVSSMYVDRGSMPVYPPGRDPGL